MGLSESFLTPPSRYHFVQILKKSESVKTILKNSWFKGEGSGFKRKAKIAACFKKGIRSTSFKLPKLQFLEIVELNY